MCGKLPNVDDVIRVNISDRIGGGYYLAKVINISSPAEDEYYALVRIQRKYQNGKITPNDLEKETMVVPLNVPNIWEFKNGR